MKCLKAILISLLFVCNSYGNYYSSENYKLANKELFEFNFNEAKKYVNKEKKDNPDNLIIFYFENYIDFIETLISGREDKYQNYKQNFSERINKIKTGNENSPYYLFLQSEMYLHTTLLNGQFKEFISAGLNFYRSYRQTEDNMKKYPEFIFNKKIKGIHELMMTIIPEEYESLFSFLGFSGTYEKGVQYIDEYFQYAKKNKELEVEAAMFKFFAVSQFGKDDNAPLEFLKHENYDTSTNIVLNISYILALKQLGMTNDALAVIEKNNIKVEKYHIPHLFYLIGSLKFTRLDEDSNQYFEKFLQYYNGEHFIKHTCRKLAWYYYIHDNEDKYNEYVAKVMNEGAAIIEHDRQAVYELSDTIKPSKTLIKVRYLYDGGYYKEAKNMLIKNGDEFKKAPLKHQVEFFYWFARLYNYFEDFEKAKKYYNYTLKFGEKISHYYFVAESAYFLGLLEENEGNLEKAKELFKSCLNMNIRKYYISIDRKAKIALKRVEENMKIKNNV